MKVRFWGTRGSIPTPGAGTVHFGGNTPCVEVTTQSGGIFILDCGTGARLLGAELVESAQRPISVNMLLTHTHWDHIQGFPFFGPVFIPGSQISVYSPQEFGSTLTKVLGGQMEFTYFPVNLDQLPADLSYHSLTEGTMEIGGVRVATQCLNHPAFSLGYRLDSEGASLIYLCDHEPFSDILWRADSEPGKIASILHEGDRRHAQFMEHADLVIHDAQYTPEEYQAKKSWGHSTYEYAVEIACAAGVKRLALMHHDPAHDDAFVSRIEERARKLAAQLGTGLEVFCAYEGCELALQSGLPATAGMNASATRSTTAALRIVVAEDDPDVLALIHRALGKIGEIVAVTNGTEALRAIEEAAPSLVVLNAMMTDMNGLEVLRNLRADPRTAGIPVLILTNLEDEASTREGFDSGATDYLAKPFSIPQLAARVHACLARASDKDITAPTPL
jgi:CheY-like chemotaxis protein